MLVGDDPASQTYVRNKGAACTEVGMTSDTLRLPATTSMAELLAEVARLNADPAVSGILVQTPLPAGLDEIAVMTALDPDKDVDGLHPISLGRLVQGEPVMVPCTPAGVQQMLLRSGVDPAGARVVVVGRSMLVGKPLALLLGNKAPGGNATVTIAHTGTRDLGARPRSSSSPPVDCAPSPPTWSVPAPSSSMSARTASKPPARSLASASRETWTSMR